MLDAFIIDELRRRQQERREDDERPALEIPAPESHDHEPPEQNHAPDDEPERGVTVVDFTV